MSPEIRNTLEFARLALEPDAPELSKAIARLLIDVTLRPACCTVSVFIPPTEPDLVALENERARTRAVVEANERRIFHPSTRECGCTDAEHVAARGMVASEPGALVHKEPRT